ncbi:hypothetical protein C8J57DRAFT_1228769 [Mycena rebaudengoi]|nr:hypothetical protein C8J57DRAFT_1228769 [Mycena rebaudengoi]
MSIPDASVVFQRLPHWHCQALPDIVRMQTQAPILPPPSKPPRTRPGNTASSTGGTGPVQNPETFFHVPAEHHSRRDPGEWPRELSQATLIKLLRHVERTRMPQEPRQSRPPTRDSAPDDHLCLNRERSPSPASTVYPEDEQPLDWDQELDEYSAQVDTSPIPPPAVFSAQRPQQAFAIDDQPEVTLEDASAEGRLRERGGPSSPNSDHLLLPPDAAVE